MRVSTRKGKFQTCPYVRGSIGIMWGGRAVRESPLRRGRKDGGRMALRAGLGDGFPPSSSRGQALRGNNGKGYGNDGEGEHEKGQVSNLPLREGKNRYYVGEGLAVREPPLRRGRMDGGRMALRVGEGMGSRPRLHEGRFCAGKTDRGMGMRERVSTRRGKFETCPYVRGRIGIMWGRNGRFANRPYGG